MSDQEQMGVVLSAQDKDYTKTINAAIDTAEKFSKKWDDTEKRVAESISKIEKESEVQFAAMQEKIEARTKAINAALQLAVAPVKVFERLMETFHKELPALDATVKTAQRLNVSTKFVEGLEYGAKRARVSFKQFELGITGIQTSLSKAEKGNSKAVRAFNDLGLSWKKLQQLSPEKQMVAVSEAIHQLPEEKRLAALSSILTGGGTGKVKQAQALMPLFKEGVEGINKMVEAGDRFGVQWNKTIEDAVARSMDARNQFDSAFEGFEKQIAAGLAPAMADILETFTKWIDKANKMGQIQKVAGEIGEALKIAAGWAKGTFEYIEKIIRGRTTSDTAAAIEESQKNSGGDKNAYTKEVSQIARLYQQANNGMFSGSVPDFNQYDDVAGTFKDHSSPAMRAQAQAFMLARDKFHINVKTKTAGTDWVGLVQEISAQRLEQQSAARTKRVGEDVERREMLGDAAGREIVPEEQKKAQREAEKAAKERARIEKRTAMEQVQFFEKRAREAKQLYTQQERAETQLKHVQERKTELEKSKFEHEASIDRSFHATTVGTVEGYRAMHTSGRADTTAMRQLEQQKKIAEQEVEANKKLDLIHAAIKARNTAPSIPLNLGS